jgi:hypothetical protein
MTNLLLIPVVPIAGYLLERNYRMEYEVEGVGLPESDEVHYLICGCPACQGKNAIYDGAIAHALKDGRIFNRFRGEHSHREVAVDELLTVLYGKKPE